MQDESQAVNRYNFCCNAGLLSVEFAQSLAGLDLHRERVEGV